MLPTADVDKVLEQLAAAEMTDLVPQGLAIAHAAPPNSVSPGDLPALVNLPGPMILTQFGSDEYGDEDLEERQYDILLLVAPRAAGVPREAYNLVTPWFAKMAEFFSSHQSLGTSNALRVVLRGDSGITQPIVYANQDYFGIRFQVTISGIRRSPYAEHE